MLKPVPPQKQKNTVRRVRVSPPAWLPESVRALCLEAQRHRFGLGHQVRKVMRKRRREPISKWVEHARVLSMSSKPGPWRNSRTPYLTGIMESSFHPAVQDVAVIKSPQVGGSEFVNNCIGYASSFDPGPGMFVYPDIETAKDNNRERITPMFEESPELRDLLSGSDNDKTGIKLKLVGMPLYMAWARSVSRLGNRPIRYLVLDEVDKYPRLTSKDEADPISLALARTTTYRYNKKVWRISTPTTEDGPIWLAWNNAVARFEFWVRCPECGMFHVMTFDQIKFPEDERNPEVIKNKALAWYECPHCGGFWDDSARDRAVRAGQWREQSTGMELAQHLRQAEPKSVAFHIPAWLSTFVSLSECVYWFLKGNDKKNRQRLAHLRHFMNAIKAEPWQEYEIQRDEDRILALCDSRPRGRVPATPEGERSLIAGLVAGVDTQKRGFYYSIRAFAYGENWESWLVRAGQVVTFEDLTSVLWGSEYRDADGNVHPIRLTLIDAMGDRTREVYQYCAGHRGKIMPIQGKQYLAATPVKYSDIEYYPGTKSRIPGGLSLMQIDTTFFKNDLAAAMAIEPGDPGMFHLHADTSQDYAQQLCAEWFDEEKRVWLCPDHKDNHYWDCEVYARAAWYALGGPFLKRPGSAPKQPTARPARQGSLVGTRPTWFSR